ncbi:hypothetical protein K438DRAFT_66556 [Mycena galopus ATCC 62051]|nr:hypothetical protein K438DRAFT_66556 [Mycena galopus ATCC 62051]
MTTAALLALFWKLSDQQTLRNRYFFLASSSSSHTRSLLFNLAPFPTHPMQDVDDHFLAFFLNLGSVWDSKYATLAAGWGYPSIRCTNDYGIEFCGLLGACHMYLEFSECSHGNVAQFSEHKSTFKCHVTNACALPSARHWHDYKRTTSPPHSPRRPFFRLYPVAPP